MTRSLALVFLAAAAFAGCRACSNCCDYSSPLVYTEAGAYAQSPAQAANAEVDAPDPVDFAIEEDGLPAAAYQQAQEDAIDSEPLR